MAGALVATPAHAAVSKTTSTAVPAKAPTGTSAALRAPAPASVPPVPAPTGSFKVLVFSKTAGFRHDSIPAGIAAIQQLGQANNFTVDATEDDTVFTDSNLARSRPPTTTGRLTASATNSDTEQALAPTPRHGTAKRRNSSTTMAKRWCRRAASSKR